MSNIKGFILFILFVIGSVGSAWLMHNIFTLEDNSYQVSNIIAANEPSIEFSPSVAFQTGILFCLGLILFAIYLRFKVRIAGELSILVGIYVFYTMIGVYDIYSRLRFNLFTMSMTLIFWTEFFGYLLSYRRLLTDLIPYLLTFASLGILLAQNTTHLIYAVLYFPLILAGYFLIVTLVLLFKFYRHKNFYLYSYSIVITTVSTFCWVLSRNWFHWSRIGWTIFLTGFAAIFFLSDWKQPEQISSEEEEKREEVETIISEEEVIGVDEISDIDISV